MEIIFIIVISIIAALATQHLSIKNKWGSVRASAFISLIGGIIYYFLSNTGIPEATPVVIMGASFAAMSSEKIIPNKKWMFISGIIFSFIFLSTSSLFQGIGGGLGTTACVTVFITLGLLKIKSLIKL